MRWTKNWSFFLILLLLVGSCVKQPEYSVVPHIDLLDITFRKGNLTSFTPDTLIFRLKFKDGDGDLGVSNYDSSYINSYNPWYYVYRTSDLLIYPPIVDNTITLRSGFSFINYAAKRKISQFDTLPPLGCGNWELQYDTQGKLKDTVYIHQNLKAYNINVDVSTSVDNGKNYTPFNPTTYWDDGTLKSCAPNIFRATFPNLSNDRKSALDGTITFRIQSFGLGILFSTKTLKMDITINDRAYHASNVVEKKDFTLQQITK